MATPWPDLAGGSSIFTLATGRVFTLPWNMAQFQSDIRTFRHLDELLADSIPVDTDLAACWQTSVDFGRLIPVFRAITLRFKREFGSIQARKGAVQRTTCIDPTAGSILIVGKEGSTIGN